METSSDFGNNSNPLYEQLSEEVKCHICLDLFDDPRLLGCGHTFCFTCLNHLTGNKGKIDCPLCRKQHKFDRQGVQGLPKNRYVANVVEKLKASQTKSSNNIPYQYLLYASSVSSPSFNHPPPTNPQADTAENPPSDPLTSGFSFEPPPFASTTPSYAPSAPPLEDLLSENYPLPTAPIATAPEPVPIATAVSSPQRSTVVVKESKEEESSSIVSSAASAIWSVSQSLLSFIKGADEGPEAEPALPGQPRYAPFSISPSQVQSLWREWAKSLWFAPAEFLNKTEIRNIQAVYVPFWLFSGSCEAQYRAEVCHYELNNAKKRAEVWRSVTGAKTTALKDVWLCCDITATRTFSEFFNEFSDWNFQKARNREPSQIGQRTRIDLYLDKPASWSKVSQNILRSEEEACKKKCKYDERAEKVKDFHVKVEFHNIIGQLVYLPVLTASYTYEGSDYIFVVSGQTGSIKGQRPYGLGKLGEFGKSLMSPLGGLLFGSKK